AISRDSVFMQLQQLGWMITPEVDPNYQHYFWLSRGNQQMVGYYSSTKKETQLYFSELKAPPAANGYAGNNYPNNNPVYTNGQPSYPNNQGNTQPVYTNNQPVYQPSGNNPSYPPATNNPSYPPAGNNTSYPPATNNQDPNNTTQATSPSSVSGKW